MRYQVILSLWLLLWKDLIRADRIVYAKRRLGHYAKPVESDVDPDDFEILTTSPPPVSTAQPASAPTRSPAVVSGGGSPTPRSPGTPATPLEEAEEPEEILAQESGKELGVGASVGIGVAGAAMILGVGAFAMQR